MKKYDEAIANYSRSLELDPRNSNAEEIQDAAFVVPPADDDAPVIEEGTVEQTDPDGNDADQDRRGRRDRANRPPPPPGPQNGPEDGPRRGPRRGGPGN